MFLITIRTDMTRSLIVLNLSGIPQQYGTQLKQGYAFCHILGIKVGYRCISVWPALIRRSHDIFAVWVQQNAQYA
jgi:hypothetical protein